MVPTPVAAPFDRVDWIFELKYDGFRAILGKHGSEMHLFTRNGNDLLPCFPEIKACLKSLPDAVIDGELVVLDDAGRAQFIPLRRRAFMRKRVNIDYAAKVEPAAVFAFDLVSLRGNDLRALPLHVRKAMLQTLLKDRTRIRYTEHVAENGVRLFEVAAELRIEGIVAKRAESPYRRGRTSDWLKIKTPAGKAIDAERAKWNER